MLRENRVLLLFLSCQAVWSLVYSQFNFLLPLNMEQLYGAKGAVWFGMLTSVNAVVVIVGTPLITGWFSRRLHDTGRLAWGQLLIAAGFLMYVFIQGAVPLYFLSMAVFTVGEIFGTLAASRISRGASRPRTAGGWPPSPASSRARFPPSARKAWAPWRTRGHARGVAGGGAAWLFERVRLSCAVQAG